MEDVLETPVRNDFNLMDLDIIRFLYSVRGNRGVKYPGVVRWFRGWMCKNVCVEKIKR